MEKVAIYSNPGKYDFLELMESYDIIRFNYIKDSISISTPIGNRIVNSKNFIIKNKG